MGTATVCDNEIIADAMLYGKYWEDEQGTVLLPDREMVDSPSHYAAQGSIECIEAMESMLSAEEFIGYLRGNSFKYRWRFRHKNGKQDLDKAEWYEKRLAEFLEKEGIQ